MSIAAVRPGLPLANVNPVAKVAATVPLSIVLVLTLDAVSATVAIFCEVVLFTAVGLGPLLWSPRTLPVWIAAPLTGISMVLYGAPSARSVGSIVRKSTTAGSAIAMTRAVVAMPICTDPSVTWMTPNSHSTSPDGAP